MFQLQQSRLGVFACAILLCACSEKNGDSQNSAPSSNLSNGARVFEEPSILNQGADQESLALAVDEQGNALLAWVKKTQKDGPVQLVAQRYLANQGWQNEEIVSNSPNLSGAPKIAIDSQGIALLVWPESMNAGAPGEEHFYGGIWGNRYHFGLGWESPFPIGSASGYDPGKTDSELGVALHHDGSAFVIWKQESKIWVSRQFPNGSWDARTAIFTTQAEKNSQLREPKILLDAKGNALALWAESVGEESRIWANRFDPFQSWGQAQRIEENSFRSSDTLFHARNLRAAFDSEGNALATWTVGQDQLWSNRFEIQTGWGNPSLIDNRFTPWLNSPRVPLVPSAVEIAFDEKGNALAVWNKILPGGSSGYQGSLWINQYRKEKGWETPQQLAENPGSASFAKLVRSENLAPMLIWRESEAFPVTSKSADRLWSIQMQENGVWSAREKLFEFPMPEGVSISGLRFAGNRQGALFLAWCESQSALPELWNLNLWTTRSE